MKFRTMILFASSEQIKRWPAESREKEQPFIDGMLARISCLDASEEFDERYAAKIVSYTKEVIRDHFLPGLPSDLGARFESAFMIDIDHDELPGDARIMMAVRRIQAMMTLIHGLISEGEISPDRAAHFRDFCLKLTVESMVRICEPWD